MGERTSYPAGTFSWVDLQTDDLDAAKRFYGELLGWSYNDIPIGDDSVYSMAQVHGHNVAGLGERQDESIPPHWNCFVTVEDADASAARAAELGATILAPPFDVFDAGRMSAFADPQGAVLSVWQAKESIGAGLVNAVGALTWNDLVTPDVEASAAFYSALFGWQITEVEGSDGQYWSITNGGRINGGLLPIIEGGHPAWNLYFACEDVDATVARANELGGETFMGPMDVPNGSRFAILRDAGGAFFSVSAGPMDD
ncbi:MAG TPA: VOC family protein [Solirubrobacteraceae bacterium]|nr:VOC family protein [Solirubrobacteraceae bacterium]